MTAKNFRVNNGLETGDVTITASSNAVTGVSSITLDNSTAPAGNAVLAVSYTHLTLPTTEAV